LQTLVEDVRRRVAKQLDEPWPAADESLLKQSTVTIPVQVNGKVRGTLQIAAASSQEQVEQAARELANVAQYLAKAELQKTIFIPDRLINFVLK